MRRERARVFAGAAAIFATPAFAPGCVVLWRSPFFRVGAARTERVRPPRGRRPLRSWATRHSLTHSPGRLHPNSRLCVRPPRAAARNLGQLTRAFASTLFLRRQTEGESPASFLTDVVYHVFSRNMVFERVIALRLVSNSWYIWSWRLLIACLRAAGVYNWGRMTKIKLVRADCECKIKCFLGTSRFLKVPKHFFFISS